MKSGYIYILGDTSHSFLKIGQTGRGVDSRIKDEKRTMLVGDLIVHAQFLVANRKETEKAVHSELTQRGFHNNKEWFECELHEAINTIERHSQIFETELRSEEARRAHEIRDDERLEKCRENPQGVTRRIGELLSELNKRESAIRSNSEMFLSWINKSLIELKMVERRLRGFEQIKLDQLRHEEKRLRAIMARRRLDESLVPEGGSSTHAEDQERRRLEEIAAAIYERFSEETNRERQRLAKAREEERLQAKRLNVGDEKLRAEIGQLAENRKDRLRQQERFTDMLNRLNSYATELERTRDTKCYSITIEIVQAAKNSLRQIRDRISEGILLKHSELDSIDQAKAILKRPYPKQVSICVQNIEGLVTDLQSNLKSRMNRFQDGPQKEIREFSKAPKWLVD